jgi:hypothetical protein
VLVAPQGGLPAQQALPVLLPRRAWGQDEKVMAFMKEPAKPRKGLPARPIVGTAVSIQLDLDRATIDEWFSQR